jgi:recombinational DNA repair protein (RecF pathway)
VFFEVVRGREMEHLTKVVPLEYFTGIRGSLEKSLAAGYVVNLLDLSLQQHAPDLRLWKLLTSWLEFLDRSTIFTYLLIDSFVISFFNLLGLAPVLDKCVVCGKGYVEMIKEELSGNGDEEKIAGLYFAGGGIVCSDCRLVKERAGEEVSRSNLKDISDMEMLRKINFSLLVKYEMIAEEKERLHNLVYDFALYHMEKDIADWRKILEVLAVKN